jgi:hypothetical protein
MSTRPATVAMLTELAKPNIMPVLFVELDFASGYVRLSTAGGPLSWNGQTWIGAGMLGTVEAMKESTNLEAHGVRLTLSGIDPEVIAIALGESYQGRPARVWLALINEAGAIVADPLLVVSGRMDTMQVTPGATAAVSIAVENDLAMWARPQVTRFTNEDQQRLYPGDKGFEYVVEASDRTIQWGKG